VELKCFYCLRCISETFTRLSHAWTPGKDKIPKLPCKWRGLICLSGKPKHIAHFVAWSELRWQKSKCPAVCFLEINCVLWTETSCYGPWLCVTFTLRFEWNLFVPVGGFVSVRQNKSRVASNPRMEYSCTVRLVVKKRQRGIKLPGLTDLENVIRIM